MNIDFQPAKQIEHALRQAAESCEGFGPGFEPQVRTAEPQFGDFQANGVLPFAKRNRANPRELGQRLMDALTSGGHLDPQAFDVEIAGPGFLNFRVSDAAKMAWLRQFRTEEDFRSGAAAIFAGQKTIVDFSSPNTAKQMHVGHIRSTVIGESVSRVLAFCGADVVRDNHIGDWGTQFGKLILAIKREGYDLGADHQDPLEDLEKLYKQGDTLTREDDANLTAAREELVKLQQGDPGNLALWEKITEVSYHAFEDIYNRLGVRFDEVLGESFYRDKVERVYAELTECGLAEESQGALVVFHPEHKRYAKQPFIVRKSDGASNYATTDLATVLHRVEQMGAQRIVYLTDARQKDHFEQLFLTVEKWFAKKGYPAPKLEHLTFGTILGEDGKAIKTRTGEPIRLKALLDEAVERAYAVVAEKNPGLPEDEKREVARVVGLGAVRYADLSQNRQSDYTFAWDKLLALEGNTAPYLLYAVARIHSIFRKAGIAPGQAEDAATDFETDTEKALARHLMLLPSVLQQTLGELKPHFLGAYLYELSGAFSTFYNADKVIIDDPAVKARRLLLCARTLRTLEAGLHLMGLETIERM